MRNATTGTKMRNTPFITATFMELSLGSLGDLECLGTCPPKPINDFTCAPTRRKRQASVRVVHPSSDPPVSSAGVQQPQRRKAVADRPVRPNGFTNLPVVNIEARATHRPYAPMTSGQVRSLTRCLVNIQPLPAVLAVIESGRLRESSSVMGCWQGEEGGRRRRRPRG
jgi:hypothetical protein